MIIDSGVVTGSLQVSGSLTVTGSSSLQGNVSITGSLAVNGPISGAITGSITNAVSASYALNASTANSATSATSASRATSALNADVAVTASYVLSAVSASRAITAQAADNAVSSSYALFASQALSASHAATAISASHAIFTLQALGATSASHAISANSATNADNATLFNSLSSSQFPQLVTNNTYTGTQYTSNTTNATSFTSTAALYTDGGLRVTKDALVSGSLSVAGNFTVFGTASVTYVTSSVLVGLEFIDLNTDLPSLRYAGINVGDSGSSAGVSSSFWYDSQNNDWIFVHAPAGSSQTSSSVAIWGPVTYNNVGNEVGVTGNYLTKGQVVAGADHDHHITSSQIFDDGTTVAIAGNLQVTGSLYAGNLTGSLNGSNIVSASVANSKLANNFVTISAGTGMSGGGTVPLGSSVTLTNAGVTQLTGGTGVSLSGATGALTVSIGQVVGTVNNVQFNGLGVGTAPSATTGEIRATNDITAFYSSDERLKENIARIEDPIAKIKAIDGVTFSWREGFDEFHSHKGADTGVIAQQIEAISLPETVTTRENGYKAVKYEKLNALLIEGIKAQQAQIDFLQQQLEEVKAILNK